MKTGLPFLIVVLSFVVQSSFAQLTGIKNIPGDYATLALAITDLNTQGVGTGGVTLNLVAGNPQTAPSGGYIIGNTGSLVLTTTSATKAITIQGNGNTVTAFSPQPSGSITDGIFKLIGADYVTITNFTLQENAGNTNVTTATNRMTEWPIALLRVSATDGAQHNTIENNTIIQDVNYLNSFGIYSNVQHVPGSPGTASDITSFTGSNSYNKFYKNTIDNANAAIFVVGSNTAAYNDDGNDIGGSSSLSGNTITDFGSDAVQTNFSGGYSDNSAILFKNQTNSNLSNNTMTSAESTTNAVIICGIFQSNLNNVIAPFTVTVNNNTVTILRNNTNSYSTGIRVTGQPTSGSFTINGNKLLNFTQSYPSNDAVITGFDIFESCPGMLIANNTLKGFTTSTATAAFYGMYVGGVVTGNLDIGNNQFGDISTGLITNNVASTMSFYGIYNFAGSSTCTTTITSNSFNGINCVNLGPVNLIKNVGTTGANLSISYNNFGNSSGTLIDFSGAQTSDFYGINNSGLSTNSSINIGGNTFKGMNHAVDCSYKGVFINDAPSGTAGASSGISNNTFTDLYSRTSGDVYLVNHSYAMISGNNFTCNYNKISGSYSKLAGGQLFGIYAAGNAVSGSFAAETNNDFSNITLSSGATDFYGINEQQGVSAADGPSKIITNNTFSSILGISGVYPIYVKGGVSLNCSSNTFSTLTSGTIAAITAGPSAGVGANYAIYNNTFTNLTGTAATAEAIECGSGITPVSVYGNSISGLRTSGTNVYGIVTSAPTAAVYDNTISAVTVSAATGSITGININAGTTVDVYRNKIYNMQHNAVTNSLFAGVSGIRIGGATSVTVHNNFVSDLKAPGVSNLFVVRGIETSANVASASYNLYYNSVYLNATSSGTNFGTAGVYTVGSATATSSAFTMTDNIIVNTSTPNGAGFSAAYRRSNGFLDNYAAASDNNLLYVGTPSATKVIFYDGTNTDQTLTAFQTRVSPRDANDISMMPGFTSATDLHLTANCSIDNRGKPVAGITTDIDMATRDVTTPDIGADEFTSSPSGSLAGIVGTAVCENRTVSVSGTNYYNSSCDLIARVLPSGGSAVAGTINACVTKDASVQTFNAEPYVARHFDIEPATNPLTSTAKVTLYFTDQEFVDFNAASAGFPLLPTVAGGGNSDPNIANLKVTQYHGTPTSTPSSPGMYTINGGEGILINPADAAIVWNGSYWAVTFDVTGFSGFYVHTNLYYPLPITLNYLQGIKQGNKNNLSWKVTCNNTPKATLTLERSNDATNFAAVYTITADALRCQQPFGYQDADPVAGKNYYRLKMTDENGKFTYSNIIVLLNEIKGFDIIAIAPNPVTANHFKLNITSAENMPVNIVIRDMLGRVMQQQPVNVIAGYNSIEMNVANLAAGMYSICGITVSDRSKVIRFVKQ